MPNPFFNFKQFTIHQERCAMKVGTDGVLLGAWADLDGASRVLDVGSGSGLIALMAAQRAPEAIVHALEIDGEARAQAGENIAGSPWADRVALPGEDVRRFQPPFPYDTLLCNPPFFIRSTRSRLPGRSIARHCLTLTHEELLESAARLLTARGTLQVVLPVPEAERFTRLAATGGWHVNRLARVLPNPGKDPKRLLLTLSREEKSTIEETIIIEIARHAYHESFVALVRDFYLNL
ncbi:MAG: methyltransferase [Odoribacteraceae bacterium]|jgi:tRNA1Val (adenine37-N6)-methyltransferase|nr:methyltransferase [Odoribacteraceae bacterium]